MCGLTLISLSLNTSIMFVKATLFNWDFRNIRQFWTHDAAVSVANAFVSSRLDYCNSLFRSLSKFNLHRLQSIQNSAARIVTNLSKYTWITPVLRKLHWLHWLHWLLVVGWTTVIHFSGVSPNSIFTDYSLSKIVQPELLQI